MKILDTFSRRENGQGSKGHRGVLFLCLFFVIDIDVVHDAFAGIVLLLQSPVFATWLGDEVEGSFTQTFLSAVVLLPCANELQGAVDLGILTGSIEEGDVKIDFYVGGDTLCFDDFLVEGEGGH